MTTVAKTEQLKDIISKYWQLSPEAIDWETEFKRQPLQRLSSLRMLRFLASVEEHLQVTIRDPDAIKTFRDASFDAIVLENHLVLRR